MVDMPHFILNSHKTYKTRFREVKRIYVPAFITVFIFYSVYKRIEDPVLLIYLINCMLSCRK